MEDRLEKLHQFFDRIKIISFWQRIFGWKIIRELSYEAYKEFNAFLNSTDRLKLEATELSRNISILSRDNERLNSEHQKNKSDFERNKLDLDNAKAEINRQTGSIASKEETIRQIEKQNNSLITELSLIKQNLNQLQIRQSELEQENTVFKQNEESRRREHSESIALQNSELKRIRDERSREIEKSQSEEVEKIEKKKQIWIKHEDDTKNAIRKICQDHIIDYVEKVPFKGSPDNTIKISDEYVIFDAKSPGSDDLQNFPNYIKNQTDSVKKYIKQEGVRKDIFLVIPSNTVEVIRQFSYNMADYNVYIVTLDVLEPLILSLKKIEEYEFVDKLSPEERENICRIVGKFAHITKRRIQIDNFFAYEFLNILSKCKADLPNEILAKVIEFEKAEKLNPPQEKRAKQILTADLLSDSEKIQREAEAKSIIFPTSVQINLKQLPLYEGEEKEISL
jgi:hypothetical protein